MKVILAVKSVCPSQHSTWTGSHPLGQGTNFLVGVFASALVSWADHSMPLLTGVRSQWFPWKESPTPHPDWPHDLYLNPASTDESLKHCVLAMPYSLKHLLAKEPWKSHSQKVWIVLIAEIAGGCSSQRCLLHIIWDPLVLAVVFRKSAVCSSNQPVFLLSSSVSSRSVSVGVLMAHCIKLIQHQSWILVKIMYLHSVIYYQMHL